MSFISLVNFVQLSSLSLFADRSRYHLKIVDPTQGGAQHWPCVPGVRVPGWPWCPVSDSLCQCDLPCEHHVWPWQAQGLTPSQAKYFWWLQSAYAVIPRTPVPGPGPWPLVTMMPVLTLMLPLLQLLTSAQCCSLAGPGSKLALELQSSIGQGWLQGEENMTRALVCVIVWPQPSQPVLVARVSRLSTTHNINAGHFDKAGIHYTNILLPFF